MQKVAAYVLERRENTNWPEVRRSESGRIRDVIQAWLDSKGAKGDGTTGTFDAEDGANATFSVETAQDGDRSWTMYRLDEVTDDGRHFATLVSVTVGNEAVTVYLTMEVGSAGTHVRPVQVDPFCPRLIRDLLDLEGRWHHGSSTLRELRAISGFENGEGLAAAILDPNRTVPFVVVSQTDGSTALPKLDEKLAFDLAGLANVFAVDEDASWALTDALGKRLSCYDGAVRVYWPHFSRESDPYRHPLWTGARLGAFSDDPRQTRERFRRQMRATMMRAAALGTIRPKEIDEIRDAAAKAVFATMKAKATSKTDFEKLADSYAADNDELRKEKATLEERIAGLQSRISELEAEKTAILVRAQNAELLLKYTPESADDIAPEGDDEHEGDDEEIGPPESGEVRFYKKTRSNNPRRDVMVHVHDCGHNSWQNAAKADKAKKGIAHLEGGRNDWKTVQHCGSCTGGGMWRVRW